MKTTDPWMKRATAAWKSTLWSWRYQKDQGTPLVLRVRLVLSSGPMYAGLYDSPPMRTWRWEYAACRTADVVSALLHLAGVQYRPKWGSIIGRTWSVIAFLGGEMGTVWEAYQRPRRGWLSPWVGPRES